MTAGIVSNNCDIDDAEDNDNNDANTEQQADIQVQSIYG
jgi:hypothetical protein